MIEVQKRAKQGESMRVFVFALCAVFGSGCMSVCMADSSPKSSLDSSVDSALESSTDSSVSSSAKSSKKSKSKKDFSPTSNFALGIFGNFGSMMGGGVEAGFCIYCGEVWQVRNAISLEAKGIKLHSDSYDSLALITHEKVIFGATLGSSLASRIGLPFFRPYLHISASFGLLDSAHTDFSRSPYYYEVQGGMGHEFISLRGHSAYFEVGGGVANLSAKVPQMLEKTALGGIFKVLVGMRFYF